MCYSKEVSLISGSIIAASSGFAYWKYVLHRARNKIKKELVPAFLAIILGIAFIGLHQFFEFFAILTGDQIIYKIGLIFSIFAMYFWLRSLEKLTNTKLWSWVGLIVIGAVAIDMFSRNMVFENVRFWVRGYSHAPWVYSWLALFVYWNVAIVYFRKVAGSRLNRKVLFWYGLAVVNLTFILSVVYVYGGTLVQQSSTLSSLFGGYSGLPGVYQGFSIIQDLPSIWCVFAVLQAITILVFLSYANRSYKIKSSAKMRSLPRSVTAKLLIWTAIIWLILYFELPYLFGAALKTIGN